MPQIDVYIFTFYPVFLFAVFIMVYMYVYLYMLPNLASVLKFRAKYVSNLQCDLLNLHSKHLSQKLYIISVCNACYSYSGYIQKSIEEIISATVKRLVRTSSKIVKLGKIC